jgi:predicted AAA+ superfamily ATPase
VRPGSELFGKAFESWVFHELSTYVSYSARGAFLSYWRLPSGIEVDFVIDDMRAAVEAKAVPSVSSHHLAGLRALKQDHPEVGARYLVSLETRRRRTADGIEILSPRAFVEQLWGGRIGGA